MRRGPLTGVLVLGCLAALALGAVAPIFAAPTPPPGLNASAAVEGVTQYLADAAGVTRSFAIHNTGSVSIGAVQIARPTGWTITACPDSPAGWTAKHSGKWCRYQSAPGTGDDIPAGATWTDFQVRATTGTFTTNRVGTWSITVSKSSGFDGPSRFRPAAPEGAGLNSVANAFRVTDAAVGASVVGAACPAATPGNHSAAAGASVTILICGRNLSSSAATPVAGQSALSGSFLAGSATGFTSGSIPAASGNVVLATWNVTIAGAGTALDLVATVGSAANKNSPLTTLADSCGSPVAGEDCVDNGGYAVGGSGNTNPVANDDGGAGFSTDEDSSFTTGDVLSNDTDADGDPLAVQSIDTTGTAGLVTDNGDGTFGYDPNGQFEALSTGDSDTDAFTYTISDGNGGTDTATVTITITGVTDSPGDVAPTITSTTPINDATGVAVDASIDVTFSEPVAASGSSFALECPAATPIAFAVTGSPGTTITVDPTGDLPAGTTCVVTVLAAGISDSDADDPPDNLASNVVFSFTTASVPGDAAPSVATTTPINGATNVALDADVDVTFSESVAASGSSFSLECPAALAVAFTVSGSPGTSIQIDPTPALPANTVCVVTVLAAGITDTDATDPPDTMSSNVTFSFTTASGPDIPPTAVDDGTTVLEDADADAIDVLANDTNADGGPKTISSASDPANGTVVLTGGSPGAATGLTYEPDPNYCNDPPGTTLDTFTYTLNGGSTATVSVTVTCVDDAPTVVTSVGMTPWTEGDLPVVIDSAVAVSDVDSGSLQGATIDFSAGFQSGDDELNFFNTPSITGIFVAGTGVLTLTGTATVADYQAALRSIVFATSHDDPSDKTIRFVVNDGTSNSAPATKVIDVTGLNDAPDAVADSGTGFSTDEDSSFSTASVLANDTDPESQPLAVQSVDSTGLIGLLTNNGDGTFFYDPNGQFEALNDGQTATDVFTYTVSDGNGGGDTATVTILITGDTDGVNQLPVANDDSGTGFGTTEDTSFTTGSALANDTDGDGDTLTVQSIDTTGTKGLVTNNNDGTFGYDPNGQFEALNTGDSDTDTFTYTVSDGNGGTDVATVTIAISGVTDGGGNTPPVATDDGGAFFTTNEDATSFHMGSVLTNDADADLDVFTITGFDAITTDGGAITSGGLDGTFFYDANGLFEDLQVGESTTDTFTYTIDDGNGGTDTATVTITISGVNDGPDAVDDSGTGFGTNQSASFTTNNVLGNDTDVETDTLTVVSMDDSAALGTVTNNLDGTFGYDPAGAFDGLGTGESDTDTFTYTISDGNGGSDTATVTINVDGANDLPNAVDDSDSTDEDTAKAVSVLGNDSDPDVTDTVTITLVGATSNGGSVSIINVGTQVQFDPGGDFQDLAGGGSRQTSFSYTISDGNGGTDTATVTITVNGINDAPTDSGESLSATGNTPVEVELPVGVGLNIPKRVSATGNLLDNATDVDDLESVLTIDTNTVTDPAHGTVSISSAGWYTYTPDAGYTGADSFEYSVVDDDASASIPQTVTITVTSRVWYVRNNAGGGGDGRSATPFATLAAADTAANANGDTIFVHRGDGTATGLTLTQVTLLNGQRLIGEIQPLVVDAIELYPAQPGGRPNIAAGVQMSEGCTVTGVQLTANAVAGIVSGGGNTNGTIADAIISSNFGGIQLSGDGSWSLSDITVTSSLLDGIQLSGGATYDFVSASAVHVTVTGGRGLAFSGATTTLAGTIDSITANTAATTGIFIDDTLGSLTIGDVNLITTGTAIDIDSANDITITNSGDASVSSSGIAVEVTTDGANPANGVDITLEDVGSTGGVSGIRLIDIGNGTFSASGGTLVNHTVAAVDIDFGSGTVTYPGTIANGTGLSVDITNRSGGTVTLNGSITDSADAGGGINLDNNDNSTIAFGGNLTLNTGASAAFVATNGGTVNASGTANTVTTTTGTGVNIAGTTIGASDVTFDTVNVDGDDVNPTNGVVVSGTGAIGNFSITGTGSAGSGGTIRDTSGDGIRLVGTLAPSLNQMTVTSNLGNGIQGGDGTAGGVVTGANLQDLVVSANGNDTGAEDGIKFNGLVGTATFSGLNVSGSARNNVAVINNTGVLTSLAISGSSIHDNHATLGSSGLVLIGDGTASMTATVGTTSFSTNRVNGILAQTNGASNLTVTVNGGTYTNHFVAVEFTHASTGSLTGTLTGATITNAINGCSGTASPCGVPVNLFMGTNAGSDAGSVLRATITNNTINNGGSANAPGIWMHTGTPTRGHARLLITGNTITNVNQNGIEVAGGGCIVAGTICDATVDATIEGNSVTLGAAGADAVHFNIGTAGTAVGNHDTLVVCGDIENNTLSSGGADAIRLRHRSTTTIRLVGYAGSAFDTAAVIAYLDGRNPAVADTFSAATSSAGGGFLNTSPAGTNCLQP